MGYNLYLEKAKRKELFVEERGGDFMNKKVFHKDTFQTSFTKSGTLMLQKRLQCVWAYGQTKQATLDIFFIANVEEYRQTPHCATPPHKEEMPSNIPMEIPETSFSELGMEDDRYGNMIDWMESEMETDEWSGLIDNMVKALEDHVSRRGWIF